MSNKNWEDERTNIATKLATDMLILFHPDDFKGYFEQIKEELTAEEASVLVKIAFECSSIPMATRPNSLDMWDMAKEYLVIEKENPIGDDIGLQQIIISRLIKKFNKK